MPSATVVKMMLSLAVVFATTNNRMATARSIQDSVQHRRQAPPAAVQQGSEQLLSALPSLPGMEQQQQPSMMMGVTVPTAPIIADIVVQQQQQQQQVPGPFQQTISPTIPMVAAASTSNTLTPEQEQRLRSIIFDFEIKENCGSQKACYATNCWPTGYTMEQWPEMPKTYQVSMACLACDNFDCNSVKNGEIEAKATCPQKTECLAQYQCGGMGTYYVQCMLCEAVKCQWTCTEDCDSWGTALDFPLCTKGCSTAGNLPNCEENCNIYDSKDVQPSTKTSSKDLPMCTSQCFTEYGNAPLCTNQCFTKAYYDDKY